VFYNTGARTGTSPVTKSSFKKFMATIANASLLSDFELQRERELAKARAIQIGMLPQGALRTADRAICYSFHPFHEVGGDFLDFFPLTDGAIGIYLGEVTGKRVPAELYAALAVGTLHGAPPRGWRGQCCCRRAEIGSWIFVASHLERSRKPNTTARQCNWNAATR
jgi:hypothetical protein